MKNLFIVNTPFHLLTSFILSRSIFAADDNYLALIHPHGYSKWADNPLMAYMASDKSGYVKVFYLLNWLSHKNKEKSYKKQADEVKNSIGKIGIERAFLGSDIDPQNQLLVAALGMKDFYRYEDGLFSYYNEDRRRPKTHEIFHKFKIWLLKKSAGIKSDMYINAATAGDSHAGVVDYMYAPELLGRYSPKTVKITENMIHTAIADLKMHDLLQETFTAKCVLFLSQPLVEKKWYTIEQELTCLKKLIQPFDDKAVLLYKPHPNDSKYKIDYYRQNFPQMRIYEGIEPAELLFAREKKLIAVASYQSTALMYPAMFSGRPFKSISLADFGQSPVLYAYKEIMEKAGIFFPQTTDELVNYMQK